MAPSFVELKAISKRVEAKLNHVMYKLHMKKTVNKAEAAVEVELINTVTIDGQGNTTKPEPTMFDQGKINMPNTATETEVVNDQQGTTTKLLLVSVDQATPTNTTKTAVKSEVADTVQGNTTQPAHTGQDQLCTTTNKPAPASEERATITADPNHTGADGVQNSCSTAKSHNSIKNLEKLARRAGRRQARKAKWAARRAGIKAKSNKLADAAFLPVTIVSCILCSPLICAADITFTVIQGVVILVIRIVDIMCAPVLLCILCRSDGY